MTPPRETPPAPAFGEIAEMLDNHAHVMALANRNGMREKFTTAASRVRSVADVLATMPDVRLGWHDYPAACIAFVARLRTALSDHQGGGE